MDQITDIDLENASPSELLLLAASLGRTDLVMSAVRNGADVNARIPNPWFPSKTLTALHAAVQNGHIDATRALLSVSADLHLTDSSGQAVLSYLPPKLDAPALHAVFAADVCQKAARADPSALSRALAAGLDPTVPDSLELGNTPLHWAASFGASECVKLLITASVPLNVVNKAGLTPLFDAAIAGHASVVRLLIAAGADQTVTDASGRQLLDLPLSEQMRAILLSNDPPSSQAQVAGSTHSYDEPPDIQRVPPTPSFIPGDNHFSAPSPGLPEWAALLWPPPQRFYEAGDSFTVPPILTVSAESSCLSVARKFTQWLADCLPFRNTDTTIRLVGGGQGGIGEPLAFAAAIFLRIDKYTLEAPAQAYSICVRDFGIDVVASDPSGLFYACATLVNLFNLSMDRITDPATPFTIPTLALSDWPSVHRRGVCIDLSRKRIPTMETLKRLVEFISRQLKINQLHLNVTGNFERLKGMSAEGMFRHEDILQLDQWCSDHFVDLVPVVSAPLNSARSDGENRENGASHDEISRRHPVNEVEDEMLYDEFLPLFKCEQVGLGNLNDEQDVGFIDFSMLRKLSRALRTRGKKTLLLYGNSFMDLVADKKLAKSVLPELPARTIMIMEADEPDGRSLVNSCAILRRHGLSFYTCASSCLSDSIAGRLSASLSQTAEAVTAASEQGAVGVLLRDTSMCDSMSPLVLLYERLLPFGGGAWNSNRVLRVGTTGPDEILARLLDTYLFNDSSDKGVLGGISVSLGDLHLITGDKTGKTLLHLLSHQEDEVPSSVHLLTPVGLRRALRRADRIEQALGAYEGSGSSVDVTELRLTAILIGVASRIGVSLLSTSASEATEENGQTNGSAGGSRVLTVHAAISSLPDGRRSDLCNNLLQAIELMRDAWMKRNHKVGFLQAVDNSVGITLAQLAKGMPYQGFLEERRAEEWIPLDD